MTVEGRDFTLAVIESRRRLPAGRLLPQSDQTGQNQRVHGRTRPRTGPGQLDRGSFGPGLSARPVISGIPDTEDQRENITRNCQDDIHHLADENPTNRQ